jgi:rod shape determining protein RodA
MNLGFKVEERTIFKRIDWNLVLFVLALNIVGLFNLYSATHGPHSQDIQSLFMNQLIWLGAGWSLFFIFTFIDYQFVSRVAYFIYFLNLGAVLYVTFFGAVALGAQRWIDLGFMRYQPSETMKLAMIMVFAKTLSHKRTDGKGMGIRDLAWPVILMGIPFFLIVKQPELGTAMLIGLISGTMLLFMKVRRWILAVLVISGTVAAPIAWTYALRDYQKARIVNFISPTNDPRGSGYNSIQSKIAVGSGRFFGKGFRKGTQSQLEFLPERHTDFIYSVLSEEFGLIGSVLVLSLFCWLFLIMVRIASTSRDKFGAVLTVGVLSYIFWHMFINMGMVIGLLPIVGVPLPLLSYGGSSMLTTMTGLGLVSAVAYRRYIF